MIFIEQHNFCLSQNPFSEDKLIRLDFHLKKNILSKQKLALFSLSSSLDKKCVI